MSTERFDDCDEEEINDYGHQLIDKQLHNFIKIRTTYIHPDPNQVRKEIEPQALQGLTQSIKSVGLLNPITVKEVSKVHYVIIAGERRYHALKALNYDYIPCQVIDDTQSQNMMRTLSENISRESLHPIDTANYIVEMLEQNPTLLKKDICSTLGKTPSWLTKLISIASLPTPVLTLVKQGNTLSINVLYELRHLPESIDIETFIPTLFELSEKKAITLIRSYQEGNTTPKPPKVKTQNHVRVTPTKITIKTEDLSDETLQSIQKHLTKIEALIAKEK
jgi:ParB family transcriptional regulator, chromosome partitioning protein